MSVRIMTAVWSVTLPDSEKIVLLALADCANDEGLCWPSMATLAAKCSKSDRTVQAAIKSLVAAGHMSRSEVPGKGCRYIVHPDKPSGMQGYEPARQHYLYRVTRPDTGEFYLGARSCLCSPSDDAYLGSGRWVKSQLQLGAALRKEVIEIVPSREALAHREAEVTREAIANSLCRNAKVATPATLARQYSPEAASPHTPADIAGRNYCGTQPETSPPEAASDKPSRTIISPEASPPSRRGRVQAVKVKPFRLPEDWAPVRFADDTVARAIVDRRGKEWSLRALESFRNWAANAADKDGLGRKVDWQAAWSNWIIEQDNRDGQRSGNGRVGGNGQSRSGHGRTVDAAERFLARRGLSGSEAGAG